MEHHPNCPPVESRPAYDELSHEVNGNVLSVRVGKNIGKIKPVAGLPDNSDLPNVRADCEDARGNRCKAGCAKVKVIPNKPPPAKLPDEEMFVLRTTRHILNSEEMRNSLEIELRTPRNYKPLAGPPAPGPTASVIMPTKIKEANAAGDGKKKKKKKN